MYECNRCFRKANITIIMGNLMIHNIIKSGLSTKRKASVFEDDYEEDDSCDLDDYDTDSKKNTQRQKEAKTSKYIFKTLFEEQQGSDVTIRAFGREWKLHKLYISQSPYFYSMFNGNWLETQKKEIDLHIEDDNVTAEALNKVFSSFYQDDIEIGPAEAVSIIGAASLLQMDHLCQQCVQVMKRNININSVISYYETAEFYSLKLLKEMSFDWLLKNLMCKVVLCFDQLRLISSDLMTSLIKSPDLIVIQTEISLYLMLKQWVFLKENNFVLQENNIESFPSLIDEYFKSFNSPSFFSSEVGSKYKETFLALRMQNLINHSVDLKTIERDNILPSEYLAPVFKQGWRHMLKIEEGGDSGPTGVNEEVFNKCCSRVGRVIQHDKQTIWRWTGFNYGLDLVVKYYRGTISLSKGEECTTNNMFNELRNLMVILNKEKKRDIMYRIGVCSLDKNGKVYRKQETGLKSLNMELWKSNPVMTFEGDMKFPILLSANFLVTTPENIEQLNGDLTDQSLK